MSWSMIVLFSGILCLVCAIYYNKLADSMKSTKTLKHLSPTRHVRHFTSKKLDEQPPHYHISDNEIAALSLDPPDESVLTDYRKWQRGEFPVRTQPTIYTDWGFGATFAGPHGPVADDAIYLD